MTPQEAEAEATKLAQARSLGLLERLQRRIARGLEERRKQGPPPAFEDEWNDRGRRWAEDEPEDRA